MTRKVLAGVVLAAAVAALALLQASSYDWSAWAPGSCLPDNCFCEAVRPGPVRQLANTWTNLGYVLVGCLILARRRPSDPLGRAFQDACALGNLLLGWGSGWFHASLTRLGEWADVWAMYLVIGAALLHGWARARGASPRLFLGAFAALAAASAAWVWADPGGQIAPFASSVALLLGFEIWDARRCGRDTRRLRLGAALAATALAIWVLDRRHIVCAPESLWQGHSAWHLLNAAALGLLYLHHAGPDQG